MLYEQGYCIATGAKTDGDTWAAGYTGISSTASSTRRSGAVISFVLKTSSTAARDSATASANAILSSPSVLTNAMSTVKASNTSYSAVSVPDPSLVTATAPIQAQQQIGAATVESSGNDDSLDGTMLVVILACCAVCVAGVCCAAYAYLTTVDVMVQSGSNSDDMIDVDMIDVDMSTMHCAPPIYATNMTTDMLLQNPVTGNAFLNHPGRWDFFISHVQGEAGALAADLFYSFQKEGFTSWLDVKMLVQDEDSMKEGIMYSDKVLVIVSEGYLQREFCQKELRWAMEHKKPLIVCIDMKHKERIGEFLKAAPEDLRCLGSINFISITRGDVEYYMLGVKKLITATPKVLDVRECESVAMPMARSRSIPVPDTRSDTDDDDVNKKAGSPKAGSSLTSTISAPVRVNTAQLESESELTPAARSDSAAGVTDHTTVNCADPKEEIAAVESEGKKGRSSTPPTTPRSAGDKELGDQCQLNMATAIEQEIGSVIDEQDDPSSPGSATLSRPPEAALSSASQRDESGQVQI